MKHSKNNNSQGPDKLNIRHLKHIGPLGLAFIKSMFKTTLNKNIIPHTWKLADIVPIPKLDTDKGTSYMPISLLSVISKTLEKSILPYITANIPNTLMQHGYKTQHSTVTALHTLNNTVAKVFNQMPPARTITVVLDMSFRHNKHTHINQKATTDKTLQAQSLSSSQTTLRDAKSTQHIESTHPDNVDFKLAFHKMAFFHPHYLTFTLQTYHDPVHRFRLWPTQTTSPSHLHTQARVQPRNAYNHTYIKFLPGQNKTISC